MCRLKGVRHKNRHTPETPQPAKPFGILILNTVFDDLANFCYQKSKTDALSGFIEPIYEY